MYGNENFFALNVRLNVLDNRIDNRVENFLRVEFQTAAVCLNESFAVADVVDYIFGRGEAIEYGIGERNFFEGRDFGKFALEFVEVDFFGGSQMLQEFRRQRFVTAVGELAHFVYRRLHVSRMSFEREPQRFESVKDARQFSKPVLFNVS